MISAPFVANLVPLPSFVQLYQRVSVACQLCLSDASLIKVDNCNALGLIFLSDGRLISACLISYANYWLIICYSVQMKS